MALSGACPIIFLPKKVATNMKTLMTVFFSGVLVSMLIVTTWASLHEDVFTGGGKILREPWGIATLADTYFAFLTFYAWVLYKEQSKLLKSVWLVLILLLGNIAMAIYVLMQIKNSKKNSLESILLRPRKDA